MTEAEWLACTDPQKMLEFLRGKASDRKLRLFACACCRRIWNCARPVEDYRPMVESAERFADGLATEQELRSVAIGGGDDEAARAFAATLFDQDTPHNEAAYVAKMAAEGAAVKVSDDMYHASAVSRTPDDFDARYAAHRAAHEAEHSGQSRLVRDVFGNPFRPVTVDQSWLTPTVAGLARSIYDERAFDILPILADALEDAGCNNADIPAHCREPGPHVMGCWAVDLILGKE